MREKETNFHSARNTLFVPSDNEIHRVPYLSSITNQSQCNSSLHWEHFPWHQSAHFGLNTVLSELTKNLGNVFFCKNFTNTLAMKLITLRKLPFSSNHKTIDIIHNWKEHPCVKVCFTHN